MELTKKCHSLIHHSQQNSAYFNRVLSRTGAKSFRTGAVQMERYSNTTNKSREYIVREVSDEQVSNHAPCAIGCRSRVNRMESRYTSFIRGVWVISLMSCETVCNCQAPVIED